MRADAVFVNRKTHSNPRRRVVARRGSFVWSDVIFLIVVRSTWLERARSGRRRTLARAMAAASRVALVFAVLSLAASSASTADVVASESEKAGAPAGGGECAATFPGVSETCCVALSADASSDAPASRRPLTRMAYASGKSPPYDAGHYGTCVHTPDASYFLVAWHADSLFQGVPFAELGLCLPSACRKADVLALVGTRPATARDVADRVDAEVRAAEGYLRAFGDAYCEEAAAGVAAAAERCRAYRLVVAALDAAAAVAEEAAGDEGANATVSLEVTSSREDRVGFARRAESAWAALALAGAGALALAVVAGTWLDRADPNPRDAAAGATTGRGGGEEEQPPSETTTAPLLRGGSSSGDERDHPGDDVVDDDDDDAEAGERSSGDRAFRRRRRRRAAATDEAASDVGARAAAFLADGSRCMSLRRNVPRLFAAPSAPGPTDCLNGMRVLSMLWIVCGHTMMMPAPINGFDNPEDLAATFGARSKAWFMLVIGGEIAVDTFFFLGGFLVAYLGAKDVDRRGGKLPVLGMLAGRYARVTPAFAATLVFYSQIASRVGDGPFFVRFQRSVFRRCDRLWWTELLYLHNFVPFDSDEVCMGWSWYLGCDMIFFACSPAVILLRRRRPRAAWVAMAAACVASFALTVRALPDRRFVFPRVPRAP